MTLDMQQNANQYLPPLDMLVTEPVVFFFSLWVSFSWATLYLQFSSVPLVFSTNHGFNLEQTGAVFTCKSKSSPSHLRGV